jgi:ABC-type uncharacterized transport system fused permease/ATPase subunit
MHVDALEAWYRAKVLTAVESVTTLFFLSGLHLERTQLQKQLLVYKGGTEKRENLK